MSGQILILSFGIGISHNIMACLALKNKPNSINFSFVEFLLWWYKILKRMISQNYLIYRQLISKENWRVDWEGYRIEGIYEVSSDRSSWLLKNGEVNSFENKSVQTKIWIFIQIQFKNLPQSKESIFVFEFEKNKFWCSHEK